MAWQDSPERPSRGPKTGLTDCRPVSFGKLSVKIKRSYRAELKLARPDIVDTVILVQNWLGGWVGVWNRNWIPRWNWKYLKLASRPVLYRWASERCGLSVAVCGFPVCSMINWYQAQLRFWSYSYFNWVGFTSSSIEPLRELSLYWIGTKFNWIIKTWGLRHEDWEHTNTGCFLDVCDCDDLWWPQGCRSWIFGSLKSQKSWSSLDKERGGPSWTLMDTSTPEPPRGQSPQFPLPTLFQQMSSTSLWPVLCLPLFYGKFIYDFWSKCDSYYKPAGRVLLHQKWEIEGKKLKNFVGTLSVDFAARNLTFELDMTLYYNVKL